MIKQIEAYEPYNEQEERDKEIILSMLTEAEHMGEDIFSRENRMGCESRPDKSTACLP